MAGTAHLPGEGSPRQVVVTDGSRGRAGTRVKRNWGGRTLLGDDLLMGEQPCIAATWQCFSRHPFQKTKIL